MKPYKDRLRKAAGIDPDSKPPSNDSATTAASPHPTPRASLEDIGNRAQQFSISQLNKAAARALAKKQEKK